MMAEQCLFLVGDAKGSDTAFQEYLRQKNYGQAIIFTSMDEPRNNLGNWSFEVIKASLKSKSHALHAFKDREMCKRADAGIMNWDSASAGTLSNVIDLVRQGKKCYLWIAQKNEFLNVIDDLELDDLLVKNEQVAQAATKRLSSFKKREKKNRILQSRISLFNDED